MSSPVKSHLLSFFPKSQLRRPCFFSVISAAVVFLMLFQIRARAQGVWNSQVSVNPHLFERNESLQSRGPRNDFATIDHIAPSHATRDFDVPGVQIGIDEVTVEPDLAAVAEQRGLAPLTTIMGITFPVQQTGSHAASVTVAQLAVPAKAHKTLQKALAAVRKHHRDEARTQVAIALAIWPRYSDALVLSALLYLGDRQVDDAIAAAEKAVRFDETNGMAHIVLAAAHSSRGEYDEALRALERALRFRPDAWQGYVERARAEIGKRQFTAALADANRAGELAPAKTPVIHFLKGSAFLNLNRTSDAVLELQAYLRINPVGDAADKARLIIERSRTTTP